MLISRVRDRPVHKHGRGNNSGMQPGHWMEQPGRSEQHEQRPRGSQEAEWADNGAHRPVWLELGLCEGDCKKMRGER